MTILVSEELVGKHGLRKLNSAITDLRLCFPCVKFNCSDPHLLLYVQISVEACLGISHVTTHVR